MAAYTTIDNPELYFQTKLYTGDGTTSNAQTFDGSEDMQANMIWFKRRSGAANHFLYDSVRGANRSLVPNDTDAEATSGEQTTYLASFDSDGFTLGDDVNNINASSETYVAWAWKESATAGFDIVSYTGDGSNRTISHSLSAKPAMIIVKQRSASRDWWVYNKNLDGTDGATGVLYLSTTDAAGTSATTSWNSTAPTTSVFSLGTTVGVNADSGTYIAYCFAEKQGYSKIGSYTGNGNADGPFVYLGFRPAFIMFKNTEAAEAWMLFDNKRSGSNGSSPAGNYQLQPNLSDDENAAGPAAYMDFCSNGFKLRTATNSLNVAQKYIYMAFAEAPFVNSNGVPNNAR
jgi:hypothetical protein